MPVETIVWEWPGAKFIGQLANASQLKLEFNKSIKQNARVNYEGHVAKRIQAT